MATYAYTFTSGDTVTPTKLNNARTVSEIVNADISATAAIAGTKVAPAFGAQDITVSGANRSITNTGNFALSFGTNNTERMRIDASGNVGIGTSPVYRLDVVGDFRVGASASANFLVNLGRTGTVESYRSAYIYGDGTNLYILNQQNGAFQFGTNNTERMRIDASGNVSIGTTLTLANSTLNAKDGITARVDAAGANPYFQLYNNNASSNQKTWRIGGISDGSLTIETTNDAYTSSAVKVTFKHAGQVRFMPLSSNPAGAESGDVYYNSVDNKLKVYNGTSWADLN